MFQLLKHWLACRQGAQQGGGVGMAHSPFFQFRNYGIVSPGYAYLWKWNWLRPRFLLMLFSSCVYVPSSTAMRLPELMLSSCHWENQMWFLSAIEPSGSSLPTVTVVSTA